jgi:D-glycero-D-manno-heptose 1,7-bisphosphate phosphatase
MQASGAPIDAAYFCLHAPEDGCLCRKPSPALVQQAAREHSIDLAESFMIGDRETDIQCGRSAGCATVWLRNARFAVEGDLPDFVARDWSAVYETVTDGRAGSAIQKTALSAGELPVTGRMTDN